MLELIDLDKTIAKEDYEQIFPALETKLGECQRAARAAGVPVVLLFEGWEAAGKGTLINELTQWLDPRGFKVHATLPPNEVEQYFPWMWRFWNAIPAAGNIAIFDCSWYGRVLTDRIERNVRKSAWRRAYEDIRQFEQRLIDSGVVIVKFWLHIGKSEQKRRFRRLADDPATAWKVGKAERRQNRDYDDWLLAVEEMLEQTSTHQSPWTIVEATQRRYGRVKVFQTVIRAIESALACRAAAAAPAAAPAEKPLPTDSGPLDRVDLTLSVTREEYEEELDRLRQRLWRLEHEIYRARIPVVIGFEGWDAAGKGGSIKRLTGRLDPRGYEVVPIAAPTPDEKARHYLWRFWRTLPKAGHITVFDRTWYGRVLVERIEGFCAEIEWKRAYEEINEFERQLADFGTVIVKFWLHVDPEEQLRRFHERQNTPDKSWKITDEDWRNREKWPKYAAAVNEMLERTSTFYAPWTVLESNCKLYARLKTLRTVAEAIEAALKRS